MGFLSLIFFSAMVFSSPLAETIPGHWQAVGYYYENEFIKPPDPQLALSFEFWADGTHRLHWQMKGEKHFCERKGLWFLDGDQLFIEVTWINPENGPGCGADPDMKLGLKTQSTIQIVNEQLWIQIPFAEKYLIYVWDRVL